MKNSTKLFLIAIVLLFTGCKTVSTIQVYDEHFSIEGLQYPMSDTLTFYQFVF